MKINNKESGMTFPIALVLIVFLIPAVTVFFYVFSKESDYTRMDKRIKSAGFLAENCITDLMRQFSQDYYAGHYDSASLNMPEAFMNYGFSSMTVTPNSTTHTLVIDALGKYGTNSSNPEAQKRLHAIIKFSSPFTSYGLIYNTSLSVGSGASYSGKIRINGNLTAGSGVTFAGDVIVNGNISITAPVSITGDCYCSGTIPAALTVTGTKYTYVPPFTWPNLNLSYYASNYNYKCTSSKTVTFNSNGTFTIDSVNYTVPAEGAIIYGEGTSTDLTISGTVKGHVTILAGRDIIITDNINYANGTNNADASDSIAIFAIRNTVLKKNSALTIHGIFFCQTGTIKGYYSYGGSSRALYIYGARAMNQQVDTASYYDPRYYIYDSQAQSYPPPSLPEKPLLVSWQVK